MSSTQDSAQQKSAMDRRRSQRIILRMPVRIYGHAGNEQLVYEETFTETVSSHGALINVSHQLPIGTRLILTNQTTEEELACKVVFQGQTKEGQLQVAVEFIEPSPKFWRVNFPPPGEKPLKRFTPPGTDKK